MLKTTAATYKFVIFSPGRCGTTSLMHVLNGSGVRCINEPFKDHQWIDGVKIKSKPVKSIDEARDRLAEYQIFDGIKTLNYQLGPKINKEMLDWFNKIAYVTRRNKIASAISRTIGTQTDKWHVRSNKYPSLSLDLIEIFIDDFFDSDNVVDNVNPKKIQKFFYEDLFHINQKTRIANVENFCNFLNVKMNTSIEVLSFLSPSNRVHVDSEYDKIPNIKEIVKRFGDPRDNQSKIFI